MSKFHATDRHPDGNGQAIFRFDSLKNRNAYCQVTGAQPISSKAVRKRETWGGWYELKNTEVPCVYHATRLLPE